MKQLAMLRRAATIAGLSLSSIVMLSACTSVPLSQPITGYTCCNLRSEKGWISSDNVQRGYLVPAGDAVNLTSIKNKYYLYGSIGPDDFGLRDDSAETQEDAMRWIHRIVVDKDPRVEMATWPADVQAAVRSGKVFVGMTRAQVAMAIGYPSPNDAPDLNVPVWKYWTPDDEGTVNLRFSDDGKLAEMTGHPKSVQVIAMPR